MQQHAPEIKAQIVLEWKAGESCKGLSRKYGVPESTLRQWTKGQTRAPLTPKNKPTLDEMAYDLVAETFGALIAIARKAQEPAWLEKQGADGLHLLFGVASDKLIRLLGAVEASHPAGASTGDEKRLESVAG